MLAIRRVLALAFAAVAIFWCATVGFGAAGLLLAHWLGLTGIFNFIVVGIAAIAGADQAIKIIREM